MLASITPLGERSRGFIWWHTATAFAIGAIGAGAAGGALVGALGALALGHSRPGLVLAIVALAAAADLAGIAPPSSRRQVNEDWLGRYRGWVYGIGFGGQLGLGVATIVTTAATYGAVALAFASASAALGGLIGASYGLVRAVSLLPGRRVADAPALMALHRRLAALRVPARRGTLALELATLATVLAVVVA
jgi:hypothetical protein